MASTPVHHTGRAPSITKFGRHERWIWMNPGKRSPAAINPHGERENTRSSEWRKRSAPTRRGRRNKGRRGGLVTGSRAQWVRRARPCRSRCFAYVSSPVDPSMISPAENESERDVFVGWFGCCLPGGASFSGSLPVYSPLLSPLLAARARLSCEFMWIVAVLVLPFLFT